MPSGLSVILLDMLQMSKYEKGMVTWSASKVKKTSLVKSMSSSS
uniref:Uncharacterized protein n=1 Tax=Arundo donax TaxID=35708 RepID=A0A0A9EWZ9_ARUDO